MDTLYSKVRLSMVKEQAVGYIVEQLTSPTVVYQHLEACFELSNQPEEVFVAIATDTKNNPVAAFEVSRGTVNQALVHPREVFKRAMLANAAGVIIAHNHPSGNTISSREDDALTKRMVEAGELLGIKVIDHLIIGDGSYFSYKQDGKI